MGLVRMGEGELVKSIVWKGIDEVVIFRLWGIAVVFHRDRSLSGQPT